jgi:predicted RNA binding protein YcfA (HicA-like mRNA interferase family)
MMTVDHRHYAGSDWPDVLAEARARGWRVQLGGKHLQLRHPRGGTVTVSSTPSNQNAVRKVVADLRRAEAQW